MSDIRRRLGRLQVIAGEKGCPTCADWDTTTVVQIVAPEWWTEGTEPTEPTLLPRPDRCPSCGRRPSNRTTVIQIVAPDVQDQDDENAGCLGNG